MTEPTWKDPLLEKWIASASSPVRNIVDGMTAPPSGPKAAQVLVNLCDESLDLETVEEDLCNLRDIIDAELARGREAVEVLRRVQWEGDHYQTSPCCPVCKVSTEYGEDYPNVISEHAPDCRLARVIGEKP